MNSKPDKDIPFFHSLWKNLTTVFGTSSETDAATKELMRSLNALFEDLSREFNASVADEPLKLAVQVPPTDDTANGAGKNARFERLIVSSSFWTLSIRASAGVLEFFLLPACELPNLEQGELASRAKLRLTHNTPTGWSMDGLPVSDTELNTLSRSLLKDLIVRSQGDYELLPESTRLVHGGLSLTRSVRSLVAERHALVQKIVNQQESILSQVARDLHDAVLGNVMLLERSVGSNSKDNLSPAELKRLLHEISTNLREVCHDIYPRDLKDLGLAVLLEEQCASFTRKTGVQARFNASGETPDLPDEVSLHVYRIAQECFNNIGKHASASNVEINLKTETGIMSMQISDDGKGCDPDAIAAKGSGTSIIKERSELINCLFPCKILFDSSSTGTTIRLEIVFASSESK